MFLKTGTKVPIEKNGTKMLLPGHNLIDILEIDESQFVRKYIK